jgi:hypothetical protein
LASLRADVGALAAIERDSAGPGERAAAEWIAARLGEAGIGGLELREFRCQRTYAGAHAAHFGLGMLGGAAALAAAVSYELEFAGRLQWIRRFLPAGTGTNVIARLPAAGERRRTLVLVAHHDAAHTGLIWNKRLQAATGGSFAGFPALAFGLAAARRTRGLGRALLAALIALQADVARSPVVPGANDNATGVAAALALAERWAREPLPGCEVIALFSGCEESGMGGMAAWLHEEDERLDPETTLALGLDTLGSGEPVVARAEGPLWPTRFRDEDLAIADGGARRAGLGSLSRFRVRGWTDPALALFAGLPTLSVLSTRDGELSNLHSTTDTPENVDWGSVEGCLRLAAGIGEAWAER